MTLLSVSDQHRAGHPLRTPATVFSPLERSLVLILSCRDRGSVIERRRFDVDYVPAYLKRRIFRRTGGVDDETN